VAAAEVAEAQPDAPAEKEKPSLAMRAAGAAARYAEGYVQLAQREAKRDVQRVAIGVGMLVIAAVLCVLAAVFAQAFLVALLLEFGIKPVYTLGVMLAGDVLVALLLVLTARFFLTRPLLPQSRKLLRETLDVLTGV